MALTKRQIDALKFDPAGKPTQILWDGELKGFGVRVFPSGVRSFVLNYNTAGGRKRRITLGSYGVLTVDQARKLARAELAKVAAGEDPVERKRLARLEERRGITWAAFAPIYIENAKIRGNPGRKGRRPKKTWRDDELRIERHVLPKWGRRKLTDITRTDVRRLHAGIAAPYEANRVLSLLSIMFRVAIDLGYLPEDHGNPASGVVANEERSRDRFVTEAEMPRLMGVIQAEPDVHLRGAFLLYLLTGLRRSELCNLRWSDVDLERRILRLGVTKNGEPHYLPLSAAAVDTLHALDSARMLGNPYVLPSPKKHGQAWNVDQVTKRWGQLRKRAGLDDVRLHDLRRTVGSWLSMSGASLSLVGAVLNHKSVNTTAIYARFATEAAREQLEQHGQRIAAIARGGAA